MSYLILPDPVAPDAPGIPFRPATSNILSNICHTLSRHSVGAFTHQGRTMRVPYPATRAFYGDASVSMAAYTMGSYDNLSHVYTGMSAVEAIRATTASYTTSLNHALAQCGLDRLPADIPRLNLMLPISLQGAVNPWDATDDELRDPTRIYLFNSDHRVCLLVRYLGEQDGHLWYWPLSAQDPGNRNLTDLRSDSNWSVDLCKVNPAERNTYAWRLTPLDQAPELVTRYHWRSESDPATPKRLDQAWLRERFPGWDAAVDKLTPIFHEIAPWALRTGLLASCPQLLGLSPQDAWSRLPHEISANLLRSHLSLHDYMARNLRALGPDALAGYKTIADANEDRVTTSKPGRLLRAILEPFADADSLDAAVKDKTSQYKAETTPPEFIIGETKEHFDLAYTHGPSSCMTYTVDRYFAFQDTPDTTLRPTDALINGDIKVAYLKAGDKVTARTLVVESKKAWVRMYSADYATNKNNGGVLQRLLTEAGYHFDAEALIGQKLRKIEIPKTEIADRPSLYNWLDNNGALAPDVQQAHIDPRVFLCPYLDHENYPVIELDDCLLVGSFGVSDMSYDGTRALREGRTAALNRDLGRDRDAPLDDVRVGKPYYQAGCVITYGLGQPKAAPVTATKSEAPASKSPRQPASMAFTEALIYLTELWDGPNRRLSDDTRRRFASWYAQSSFTQVDAFYEAVRMLFGPPEIHRSPAAHADFAHDNAPCPLAPDNAGVTEVLYWNGEYFGFRDENHLRAWCQHEGIDSDELNEGVYDYGTPNTNNDTVWAHPNDTLFCHSDDCYYRDTDNTRRYYEIVETADGDYYFADDCEWSNSCNAWYHRDQVEYSRYEDDYIPTCYAVWSEHHDTWFREGNDDFIYVDRHDDWILAEECVRTPEGTLYLRDELEDVA